ncbi:MAG: hypothetical protein D6761_13655 [Candidatus Dadabacteria bacterium]|nr:MAG: hypothetical protein D6761_13655 [Candidatus Dadabacteria bacterium]
MRRLWSIGAAAVCAVAVSACGGGGVKPPPPESLSISGVSAAWIPDERSVRVGWLPVAHPDLTGFRIERTGPLTPTGAVPTSGITWEPIADVDQDAFLYDDPDAKTGQRYGYRVGARFSEKAAVTAEVVSSAAWVDTPAASLAEAILAETAPDVCVAVTDASGLTRAQLTDGRSAQAATVAATSPAVQFTARTFEQREYLLRWRVYARNELFSDIGALNRGRPVDTNEQTLTLQPGTVECHVEQRTTFDSIHRPLSGDLEENDYALVAELIPYGTGASFTKLVGPVQRVVLPNAQARAHVALTNVTPEPGNVLRPGLHLVQANIAYGLDQTIGRNVSAQIRAVYSDGSESLLDVFSEDPQAASGTMVYATAITVTGDMQLVRLIGRAGTGALDSVLAQDEVDYVVAP